MTIRKYMKTMSAWSHDHKRIMYVYIHVRAMLTIIVLGPQRLANKLPKVFRIESKSKKNETRFCKDFEMRPKNME